MKYYQVSRTGALSNLKIIEAEDPTCSDGRVLVKVKSIGINYADIFAVMGLYSATPKTPFTPGLEFAGDVIESRSTAFHKGQRVVGVTRFGGYSSHIVADPDYLRLLPADWTYQEGAAFPVQTLTAYYALRSLGDLQPGQTVLIHSAAGGVGLQANRIAKKFNAYTVGVVGSREKLPLLTKENFDRGIVRSRGFYKDLQAALGDKPLNLVLEATGGKFFKDSYQALAPMGRVVAYGSAQFTPSGNSPNYFTLVWKYLFRPRVDPLTMITQNKSVMGFNLIWLYEQRQLLKTLFEEIERLRLPPPNVGHQFDFIDLPSALKIMKEGKTTGKLVVNL